VIGITRAPAAARVLTRSGIKYNKPRAGKRAGASVLILRLTLVLFLFISI